MKWRQKKFFFFVCNFVVVVVVVGCQWERSDGCVSSAVESTRLVRTNYARITTVALTQVSQYARSGLSASRIQHW